ncbi:MAG: D-alanyl-D-alanine carboxypeptidase, partial [Clostridium sp.]
ALAQHISGSNEAFGILMTERAKELGANNTTFKNPSGLHEEGHLTTAYDLSLIMRAAYNNPNFNEVAREPYYFYKNQPYSDGSEKWASNRNHCINSLTPYYYEYCYSGKVGYTPEANHTYTSSAVKNGQVLIASFLNAENKDAQFSSVGPLFEYGFQNFETIKLVSKDDKIADYTINDETIIPLLSSKDFYYSKSINDIAPQVTFNYDIKDYSKENISKGESLFNGNILLNGEVYGDLEFISDADREYTFKLSVDDSIDALKQNKLAIAGIFILLISIISLLIILFIKFRRHMSNKNLN